MTLALVALIVAATTPSPAASPLKEIYHAKSTPFCTVYRENVFRAVQGLMINDVVIAKGGELLAAMGRDPYAHGIAQYRLGQIVYETASNLAKIYRLLNAPAQWSLSQNEPAAQTGNEFATDLWLTGQVENLVAPAVLPGVNRCKSN